MSLSAREQQALDSITGRLADSDPELAALLTGFTRLASGEEMPQRERIRAGPRRAIRCSRRQRRHPRGDEARLARRPDVQPPGLPVGRAAAVAPDSCHGDRGDDGPQPRQESGCVHDILEPGLRKPGSRARLAPRLA